MAPPLEATPEKAPAEGASSSLYRLLAKNPPRALAADLTRVRLAAGEVLFRAGGPGDALYLVVYGRLRALLEHGREEPTVLGEIGRGESVGEMALLTGDPRSATVCAIRPTELIRLDRAGFDRLVDEHPAVTLELTRLIVDRYRRTLLPPEADRPATIALVPSHPDVPLGRFTRRLTEALEAHHTLLHLSSDRVAQMRERADPDDPELLAWLHAKELEHGGLIYEADATPTPWTRLCTRQVDTILVVGSLSENRPPDPRLLKAIGRDSWKVGPRRELVLLRSAASGLPTLTDRWRSWIRSDDHHHVDPDRDGDMERLARLLAGEARGLVLGGGGARGLAHIGVIRALEEAGLVIDRVGGTSIGAMIGAQYASGWSPERMREENRRAFIEQGPLNDYTLPVFSVLRCRRYVGLLGALFGERRIEDLPLGFFCTSTNLTRGELMVHRSGLIRRWVRASTAVPGLGPAVYHDREVLVDGGALDNLPTGVMRDEGRGPVYAVSVSPEQELELDGDYSDMRSPWRHLLDRANPFAKPARVPNIATLLLRTVSLPVLESGEKGREAADLVFRPPVERYRLLDWSAMDELIEIGYRTAVSVLEKGA